MMMTSFLTLLLTLLYFCMCPILALVPPPRSLTRGWRGVNTLHSCSTPKRSHTLVMRDASSANAFKIGDRVKVVDDVEKAGVNLRGRVGTVKETWIKCDVDPTCCCAEFVDDGFAVHVTFERNAQTDAPITEDDSFVHYFAERELIEVKEERPVVAFDGMSCKAFKLDQLKMGEQAKRIAAFEESRAKEEETLE